MRNKGHSTQEGLDQIRKIKAGMNKGRIAVDPLLGSCKRPSAYGIPAIAGIAGKNYSTLTSSTRLTNSITTINSTPPINP